MRTELSGNTTEQIYFPNLRVKSLVEGNDQDSVEIYDPELVCESCGKTGCYFIDGEKYQIGSCRVHIEENKYWSVETFRDEEELRLNYCKRCGSSLDEHDDKFCHCNKYPALSADDGHEIIKIAEKYKIDLTSANQKQADNGRHGAVEGDINANICQVIKDLEENGQIPTVFNITPTLKDWGHEESEINTAFRIINENGGNFQ